MAKKLYVGNLSYGTTDDILLNTFSQFGTVTSANVLVDKFTNRSRGFGFVEMANDEEAEKAIAELNGKEIDGRAITVNEARPMGEKPPRRPFRPSNGPSRYGAPRREEY